MVVTAAPSWSAATPLAHRAIDRAAAPHGAVRIAVESSANRAQTAWT
jgi:hypothetical protein